MTGSSGSIAFDRAATFYDRTRRLAPETQAAVMRLLAEELEGRGRCLEIGVGTGRMALPLAHAGIRMAGVDLALPMLKTLLANAGGRPPFPIALADATELPFRSARLGAGLACHVLHLIERWDNAVVELVRVVRPGGVLLFDLGGVDWRPDELERRFASAAGITRRNIGINGTSDLDDLLTSKGARLRLLDPIVELRTRTIEQRLRAWEQNLYSFTWRLDDDTRLRAVDETRRWAEERYGRLDTPESREWTIRWRAYDLP